MDNAFKNMGIPEIDVDTMMNAYKKNLDTIHTANQVAADVMNSLNGLQNKFMQQTLEDMGAIMKKMIDTSNVFKPSETVKEYTKMNQDSWTKTINHGKDLAEMMAKTGSKVSDLLRERVREHMDDLSAEFSNAYKKTKH